MKRTQNHKIQLEAGETCFATENKEMSDKSSSKRGYEQIFTVFSLTLQFTLRQTRVKWVINSLWMQTTQLFPVSINTNFNLFNTVVIFHFVESNQMSPSIKCDNQILYIDMVFSV